MGSKTFNLALQPWIKLEGADSVGLRELFALEEPPKLAGTPTERFVVFRLLLAVLQAACTLEEDDDLEGLSIEEMKANAVEYLDIHADAFDLFDEKHPFLQYPQVVSEKKALPAGALVLGVCTGNATLLLESNSASELTAAEEAYLLLHQLILGFGGKKADMTIILSKDLQKRGSAPASPALGRGWLHSVPLGKDLFSSLWLNLLTEADLRSNAKQLTTGIGRPAWEHMPDSEDSEAALTYAASLQGRLLPLSRFCLLEETGMFNMTTGIAYPPITSGVADPSVSLKALKGGVYSALRAQTGEQPWRQIESILAFDGKYGKEGCWLMNEARNRGSEDDGTACVGVWCVGLQISDKAGEQYFSAQDGFVEQKFMLHSGWEAGGFLARYVDGMKKVSDLSKILYSCVASYFDELTGNSSDKGGKTSDAAKKRAAAAVESFWRLADTKGSEFVNQCSIGECSNLIRIFAGYVETLYFQACTAEGARQLLTWAKQRPNLSKFRKSISVKEMRHGN